MKKVAFVFVLIFTIVALYLGLSKKHLQPKESIGPEVLGVPFEEKGIEVEIGDAKFKAFYLKVPYGGDITLIPNFSEKETAINIFEKAECQGLISGGFYTPQDSPTGLFISEGKETKKYISSSLTNAVYSLNDFETPRITREPPRDHLRVALQAGPLLIENSFSQNLKLLRDEEARRIVLAVTGENETVFIVFYNPDSAFAGPKLDDLANALEDFEKKTDIVLADAMNLDGGTASAFYTQEIKLSEASLVGSFFCVRK